HGDTTRAVGKYPDHSFVELLKLAGEDVESLDFEAIYGASFIDEVLPHLPRFREARFGGGEPFQNELCFRIWDRIAGLPGMPEVVISTNGQILDDRVKDLLERLKPTLVVSIDSLDTANMQ